MAFKSFDDRLQEEECRRDAALARMRASVQTSQEIAARNMSELQSDMKQQFNPRRIVGENPWISMGAAAVVGLAIVPMIRRLFSLRRKQPTYIVAPQAPQPQRVVVEVIGAAERKEKKSSPWGKILDAAVAGLPAVATQLQKYFAQQSVAMEEQVEAEPKQPAQKTSPAPAAGPEPVPPKPAPKPAPMQPMASPSTQPPKPAAPEVKFPKSMSRRSAPPPRES